jgi:hypothetical protein
LLALAGTVAYAPETSPWSRARINELIDTLLALATVHGFAHSDALGEMLATGFHGERIRKMAEIASAEVPYPKCSTPSGTPDPVRICKNQPEAKIPGISLKRRRSAGRHSRVRHLRTRYVLFLH